MTENAFDFFRGAVQHAIDSGTFVGVLGRANADGTTTVHVPSKAHYVYVDFGAGTTTGVIEAINLHVPNLAGTPVRLARVEGLWIITGMDYSSPFLKDIHRNVPPHDHQRENGLNQDVLLLDRMPSSLAGAAGQVLTVGDDEQNFYLADASGGSGAVDSVNGQTGVVSLDTDDIAEGSTNLYLTQERVEDFVAAQFTGNTGIIDATYDDGTGAITLTLDVSAADRYLYSTGADAWAEGTITSFARGLLDDADAATMRSTLGLVIGTNVQAQDAELAAIAGLTSAADRLPYFTGSGTASLATFTSFGRDLLDDANAAAGRTTLGITVYDQETTEDIVGAMVSSNTETGISVTYDDSTGKLNFDAQTAGDARYVMLTTAQNVAGVKRFSDNMAAGHTETPQKKLHVGIGAGSAILVQGGTNNGETAEILFKMSATDFGSTFIKGAMYFVRSDTNARGYILFALNNTADSTNVTTSNGVMALLPTGQAFLGGLTSGGASVLGVKAGTSSNDAAVGGVLYVTTTQTGNVGTGTDDIAAYTVPANTLAVNNQSLWFEAWGTIANNANAKTMQAVFGGTTLGSWTFSTGQADTWIVRGRIARTGAATQKGMIGVAARFAAQPNQVLSSPAETLSGTVALKIQGIGTSNNDIVCEGFVVGYDDANT
jgi:hypothetical protein